MTTLAIVRAELTSAEWAIVSRPVVGNGGAQKLLRKILQRVNRETMTVELGPVDWSRVIKYADEYGDGGFQDRFRALITAEERTRRLAF